MDNNFNENYNISKIYFKSKKNQCYIVVKCLKNFVVALFIVKTHTHTTLYIYDDDVDNNNNN